MSGDVVRFDVDADGIPAALRDRPAWVCWRIEQRDGAPTKVPVDAETDGRASSTDDATWTDFETATEHHRDDRYSTAGVGFVFSPTGPFVGIDLDDCRDPESDLLDEWARDFLDDLETYTEISPSGTGAHAIGRGDLPDGGNRRGDVEMYDEARFFTVTGCHIEGTPTDVEPFQDALEAVHSKHVASDDPSEGAAVAYDWGSESTAVEPVALDNQALVSKAKDADDGGKFRNLWQGSLADYDSHSEGRMALLVKLAFWTGKDPQRMDRLYRKSGLYPHPKKPGKWDRIGDDEIQKAIHQQSDVYNPSSGQSQMQATTPDGGIDTADVIASGPGSDGNPAISPRNDRPALSPASVAAVAGLGEDDSISDLNDREKAAVVWRLVRESDDVHVRVRRDNGGLWAYDDGIWNADGERALRHAARQALRPENYGQNVLAELKAQANADPSVEVDADDFGLEPGLLAVTNGVVDLDVAAAGLDALSDLTPEDLALTRLPVEYNPDADDNEWRDYVNEWAEDGKADALQEYVGYCLHIGEMPIHRAILLVGSGANGKGTFLHVVRALLGEDNTTSIELQTLANERDAVADFYGSLANIDDDLSARKLGAGLGMFKKLVAGDRVRGRRLYQDAFEFDATGKHLYAANEVPDVADDVGEDDEAFWRRWLLVEFPNHYPPAERDPDLKDVLATPAALSGILNWAIDGRARLLEQSHFTNERRYAQGKRERWQAWGDSVNQFITDCVERDSDADNITTGDVHRRYCAWCREHDEKPVGQQQFTTILKNEDVGYGTSVRIDGSVQRGYKALGFSDDVPDNNDTPKRSTRQSVLEN